MLSVKYQKALQSYQKMPQYMLSHKYMHESTTKLPKDITVHAFPYVPESTTVLPNDGTVHALS